MSEAAGVSGGPWRPENSRKRPTSFQNTPRHVHTKSFVDRRGPGVKLGRGGPPARGEDACCEGRSDDARGLNAAPYSQQCTWASTQVGDDESAVTRHQSDIIDDARIKRDKQAQCELRRARDECTNIAQACSDSGRLKDDPERADPAVQSRLACKAEHW